MKIVHYFSGEILPLGVGIGVVLFRKFVRFQVVCAKRMTIMSSSYLWPDVWNAGKNQVLVFFNAGKSEQPNNNIPDDGLTFIRGNFLGLLLRSGQASGRQIWMALLPFVSGAGENLTVLQHSPWVEYSERRRTGFGECLFHLNPVPKILFFQKWNLKN